MQGINVCVHLSKSKPCWLGGGLILSTAPAALRGDGGGDRGEHRLRRPHVRAAAYAPHLPCPAQPGWADVPLLLPAGHTCPALASRGYDDGWMCVTGSFSFYPWVLFCLFFDACEWRGRCVYLWVWHTQICLPLSLCTAVGLICAAPAVEGAWWRAQVISFFKETSEVEIRYVDYGGYDRVKIDTLRQIR